VSISTPFIKRPIATSLLTAALALTGTLAFYFLPVAPLPQIEYPTLNVNASLPGASPDTMASAVTTPLERSFGRIAGITEMTSSSSMGSSQITMQFELDRNLDAAGRDVQAAINAARGQLPSALPSNPNYRKNNPSDRPILVLALTSDIEERSRMYDIADSLLDQRIAQIPGIGTVNIQGSSKPAVRVQVNPSSLTKFDIGWDQIAAMLGSANANRPKGQLSDGQHTWNLATTDQLLTAAEYRQLIVTFKNGAPIRLSDIATVEDSFEDRRTMGLANGKPAVLIQVFKQPTANIIDTVDRIYALLPYLKASIPPSIQLSVNVDRTRTIRASIADIEHTIVISIVLVIVVVFIFLRNIWATIIPSVSVPLSLLGTFGVMYLLGYSVDNLSLMALAISTGFVVDDAIVVIENISRYLEMGMRPAAAALTGAKEIGFTVLSMSISLCAVFIPILMMGGILGRLFREFAVTLAVSIGISLIVSLTATPSMCAKFLKPHGAEKQHGWMYRISEKAFDWLLAGYRNSLRWVLRHPAMMLMATIGTMCLTVYLYVIIPKGFFPQQDTGRIQGNFQGAPNLSFPIVSERLSQFMKAVQTDPAVQNVSGNISGTRGFGQLDMELKPLEQRKLTADQIVARLRPKTQLPGASLFLQAAQEIKIGGRNTNSQFQYTIQGDTTEDIQKWATIMLDALKGLPQLRDSNTDLQNKGLEAKMVIDRDTAGRLGVTPQLIDSALYSAFGQRQVSTIYRPLNQYHVVMEAQLPYQQNPDSLKDVYVRSSNGVEVPLTAFIHYEAGITAQNINHQGQFPAVTLSFNLAPGVSLGEAVDAVRNVERQVRMPANVHGSFQGAAAQFQASLTNMPLLILAALLTVYIVLGVLYESYIHPITILSTLPSAGVGALLALIITNSELNVIGVIGIILLIGIVKKNAIMMIDFALEAERKEGKGSIEGIYQACQLRFRPIMMTTMAALLGGLPLALGTGTGSEMRRPLGITIVGGLMVSQILTLYTTPVIYIYLDRLRLLLDRNRARLRGAALGVVIRCE
jgi:multidrug efflux pump